VAVTTNFNQWEKEFTGQCNVALNVSEKVLHEACQILYQNIVDRTPVGDPSLWKWPAHKNYTPGTLKASWTIEFGNNEVTIENLQPYAYRVETGYSTQAPAGMMRISLKEFQSIIDAVSRRHNK